MRIDIRTTQKSLDRLYGHDRTVTIELTGSSPKSSDDAVRVALEKAAKTLRNMHWFEVTETRGHIEDGQSAALAGHHQDGTVHRRLMNDLAQ